MQRELREPLEFAVQDIIQGSYLNNNTAQFTPVVSLKYLQQLPASTVWPQITAVSTTVGGNDDTITKDLVLAIYFPFPGVRENVDFTDYMTVASQSVVYQKTLMDILFWLIGKYVIPPVGGKGDGEPVYDFNLAGDFSIQLLYENTDEEARDLQSGTILHDLCAVVLTAEFTGDYPSLDCCQGFFNPAEPGTSRDNFVTG